MIGLILPRSWTTVEPSRNLCSANMLTMCNALVPWLLRDRKELPEETPNRSQKQEKPAKVQKQQAMSLAEEGPAGGTDGASLSSARHESYEHAVINLRKGLPADTLKNMRRCGCKALPSFFQPPHVMRHLSECACDCPSWYKRPISSKDFPRDMACIMKRVPCLGKGVRMSRVTLTLLVACRSMQKAKKPINNKNLRVVLLEMMTTICLNTCNDCDLACSHLDKLLISFNGDLERVKQVTSLTCELKLLCGCKLLLLS